MLGFVLVSNAVGNALFPHVAGAERVEMLAYAVSGIFMTQFKGTNRPHICSQDVLFLSIVFHRTTRMAWLAVWLLRRTVAGFLWATGRSVFTCGTEGKSTAPPRTN